MRAIWLAIVVLLGLSSCTSTRSLSRKFSEKPLAIQENSFTGIYANMPEDALGKTALWGNLVQYKTDSSFLSEVGEDATIQLTLVKDRCLKVEAYHNQVLVESFEIPVRKKKKYLILENKNLVIPIPILYFEMKEDKTVLALLQNNRIGISSYSGHTLWILFFGASNDGKSSYEYEEVR